MSIAPAIGYDLGEFCRNCHHVGAWHVDGHDNEKLIPCDKPKRSKKISYCKCMNFVPADNLKYLELMSEKKGKK